MTSFGGDTSDHQAQIDRFLVAYRDLAFGYHFVRAIVKAGIELPPDVYEKELIDFYWFEKTGERNGKIVEALAIHHPSSHFIANSVQAMLLSDESYDRIAGVSGIDAETLRTYEQLFFNVRDRRDESLFIANVVYPDTRLVETMENYIREMDSGSFLKRSAYNNGLDDVSYFIGLRVESVEGAHTSDSQELASRLESSIMANGYYLARNGFLGQRSAQGVASAKSLIVAAKQGGEDTREQDNLGASSIGDALVEELDYVKGGEMRERIRKNQLSLNSDGTPAEQSNDDLHQSEEEALSEE